MFEKQLVCLNKMNVRKQNLIRKKFSYVTFEKDTMSLTKIMLMAGPLCKNYIFSMI